MPREKVPYSGGKCSLKERLAEIWDLLGQKLQTINGVKGDGAGNVTIYSQTPAILINADAAHNQIGLDFDLSEVVTSVNGQTGDVALNAGDVLGADNLGSATKPIYLSGGAAIECNEMLTVNDGYATAPYRTYNSANIYDIVTIGSLAANPSVLHTTGNENKDGSLSIRNVLTLNTWTGATTNGFMEVKNSVSNVSARLIVKINQDGSGQLFIQQNRADGTWVRDNSIITFNAV